MGTPSSNTTKTIKCSVKDLATTLYSCSFPTDFSDEECDPAKLCTSSGKMMSNQKVDESREKENQSPQKKVKNSAGKKDTSDDDDDEANWPSFSNDDYMVFCFKEGGGIDLEEIVLPETEQDSTHSTPKGVEKERKHSITEFTPTADDEEHVKVITEVHARLSDSARSDSSSSSFAFPVMSREWRGSPVRMPKLGAPTKTRKSRTLISCLRF